MGEKTDWYGMECRARELDERCRAVASALVGQYQYSGASTVASVVMLRFDSRFADEVAAEKRAARSAVGYFSPDEDLEPPSEVLVERLRKAVIEFAARFGNLYDLLTGVVRNLLESVEVVTEGTVCLDGHLPELTRELGRALNRRFGLYGGLKKAIMALVNTEVPESITGESGER